MKKSILLIILSISFLQSCNVGSSKTWKNDNISHNILSQIEALDKQVIEAVVQKNSKIIKSLMSDQLLEKTNGQIDMILEQASNFINTKEYSVLDQYRIKTTSEQNGVTILSGVSNLNDYIINFQALNEELFISLLIPKGGIDKFIVANIYGKYPEGWKLNIIHFGQYKINGQTAPELYKKAMAEYDKGFILDAVNNMVLNSQVAKPVNNYWEYQNEKEMKEFYDKVMAEINSKYKFPYTLTNIDSNPKIVSIYPRRIDEGYFPMIEYVTTLDLKDTIKTKQEYENIHSEVVEKFKGIDKEKDYIFYKAFSDMPNGKTPIPTYGFVKELK